jgi:beta-1,4-mannosyltransferase
VLLSLCDIGVCLHYSSSGLDLPMKVVDMFGAGIPVLAINYETLNELLKHNKNGLIFNNAEELTKQLSDIVKNP